MPRATMGPQPLSIDSELDSMTRSDRADFQWGQVVDAVLPKWATIGALSIVAGAVAYGITFLISPTFTARAAFISPQQQQNSAASALASLGALAGLAGAGGAIKSPADQYIAVMQSATVNNRIIDRFELVALYESKFRVDAQKRLKENVRITAGKKDNLITVEVDDKDPVRAAGMANAYIEELRWVTNKLALTEAQQRRAFFEQQLLKTKDALRVAQLGVQKTGFTAGALKSEPKSAAEAYARTRAELAATDIRLGALRRTMTENSPDIQRLLATQVALRAQLSQFESPLESTSSQDYVSAYREFKYQEALFEIFAKQFELAKMDEAREGTLIQVLDPATPPERKSKPVRSIIAASTALVTAILAAAFFAMRSRRARQSD